MPPKSNSRQKDRHDSRVNESHIAPPTIYNAYLKKMPMNLEIDFRKKKRPETCLKFTKDYFYRVHHSVSNLTFSSKLDNIIDVVQEVLDNNYNKKEVTEPHQLSEIPTGQIFASQKNARPSTKWVSIENEDDLRSYVSSEYPEKIVELMRHKISSRKTKNYMLPSLITLQLAVITDKIIQPNENASKQKSNATQNRNTKRQGIPKFFTIQCLNPCETIEKNNAIKYESTTSTVLYTYDQDMTVYNRSYSSSEDSDSDSSDSDAEMSNNIMNVRFCIFRHDLLRTFIENVPGYSMDKKILSEESMLCGTLNKCGKEMELLNTSEKLNKFFMSAVGKMHRNQQIPTVRLCFGASNDQDNIIDDMRFFDKARNEIPIVPSTSPPRKKLSSTEMSNQTRETSSKARNFLLRLYNDPTSPLYHGFTKEMMNYLLVQIFPKKMNLIEPYKNTSFRNKTINVSTYYHSVIRLLYKPST